MHINDPETKRQYLARKTVLTSSVVVKIPSTTERLLPHTIGQNFKTEIIRYLIELRR